MVLVQRGLTENIAQSSKGAGAVAIRFATRREKSYVDERKILFNFVLFCFNIFNYF